MAKSWIRQQNEIDAYDEVMSAGFRNVGELGWVDWDGYKAACVDPKKAKLRFPRNLTVQCFGAPEGWTEEAA